MDSFSSRSTRSCIFILIRPSNAATTPPTNPSASSTHRIFAARVCHHIGSTRISTVAGSSFQRPSLFAARTLKR